MNWLSPLWSMRVKHKTEHTFDLVLKQIINNIMSNDKGEVMVEMALPLCTTTYLKHAKIGWEFAKHAMKFELFGCSNLGWRSSFLVGILYIRWYACYPWISRNQWFFSADNWNKKITFQTYISFWQTTREKERGFKIRLRVAIIAHLCSCRGL